MANPIAQKDEKVDQYTPLEYVKYITKRSAYIRQQTKHSNQCSVSSQVRPTVLNRSASVTCFPLEKYPAAIFASISTRESGGMRWSERIISHT